MYTYVNTIRANTFNFFLQFTNIYYTQKLETVWKNWWTFQMCINSVLFSTETKLMWILVEQCVGVAESAYHFHRILWHCTVCWQTSAKCHRGLNWNMLYAILGHVKNCTLQVQQLSHFQYAAKLYFFWNT